MWTILVAILSPFFDHHLCLGARTKSFEASSRNLPLKLSTTPFCQDLPGSINAVLMSCAAIHDSSVLDTNSGPLSMRKKRGVPCVLTSRDSTSMMRAGWMRPSTSIALREIYYRQFANQREVGGFLDLTPSPARTG
jgi:hypothetical protein